MIEYKNGDLLEDSSEALINAVNSVGAMGRGIALQFKKKFSGNYKFYQEACKRGDVKPGKVLVYETRSFCNPRYIINFPTKIHWRGASKIEYIQSGLIDLVKVVKALNIASAAIPPLGCGLGGLDWKEPLIETSMSQLTKAQITIYEPIGAPNVNAMVYNQIVQK
jgi:O-acetyl-ADP-ribose deacetylase (regulator of RNase III)